MRRHEEPARFHALGLAPLDWRWVERAHLNAERSGARARNWLSRPYGLVECFCAGAQSLRITMTASEAKRHIWGVKRSEPRKYGNLSMALIR